MAGCRSLTDLEIAKVIISLGNNRDKCLFILGYKTGFRISELLSLTVQDVYQAGRVADYVRVQKRNTKGKLESREQVLHPMAKEAIKKLLGVYPPDGPLFRSRVGINKAITRFQAHKILKAAYALAGARGPVATHSLRKTFAQKIYTGLGFDLIATRDALGHRSITNTVKYLDTNRKKIDAAILAT